MRGAVLKENPTQNFLISFALLLLLYYTDVLHYSLLPTLILCYRPLRVG